MDNKIVHAAPVPPFVTFVASAVPMVFDNSMSYYEALCALWKWLQDDVINVINNNATVTEEYIQMTKDMKEYMDNYFDNLDVQEEINNKLDAMVEDGTLQEIITTYIQANVAWTFDTVFDMKASENLIAGSYAQTLGFNAINDGGGALYKITNTGTANEMNVIAVGSLFANLVYGEEINLKQLGVEDNDDITDALEVACSLVDRVIVSDGSYNMTKVQLAKDIEIKFINCDITKTDVESGNESGAFEIRGTVASTTSLTAAASALANTISVADDTDLAVGDTIHIFYDEDDDTQENYHKQLITTITSVNSGSVTIADALNWDYSSGCKVSKLNTVKAILTGENMTYNNSGLTGKGYFAYLRRNRNSVISGIVVKNSSCGVARILQSIDSKVSDCTGYIPVSTAVPYGEFITLMYSTNVNVYRSHTIGYRRSVDYVGASYCSTYDSIAEDGGFTTHGCLAKFCRFVDCKNIYKYNTITNCNTCGNLTYFYDKDITYQGCTIINGSRGIYVVNDDTTVLVKDCDFENITAGILNYGVADLTVENCRFNNVRDILYIENNKANAHCTLKDIIGISKGSGTAKVISGAGVTNAVKIYNSTFETTQTFINSDIAVEMYNCEILSSVTTAILCASGTKIYNCYFPKDIKVNSNCVVNGCNFRNATVADGTISGTNIEGNLIRGTISLADGSGNHVANNTTIH